MKKENKKMAQERRAQERKKAQKKAALVKQLKFWIPLVATVVVVAVLVWAIATSGSSSSSSDDSSTATETSTTDTSSSDSTSSDSTSSDSTDEEDSSASSLDTTEGLEAKDGDTVNIDYTGYLDGEAFDGGSTNGAGADLELGSNTYIDGFEDGIVGHKVGESFDLNLTFPENYGNSDLAGKAVTFTVTLNGIYK